MVKQDLAGYAGKVIKDIRVAKAITLMQLAEKVNISYQQLQKYENGSNRVTVDRLYEIARCLQTDVTEFFPSYAFDNKVNPQVLKASYELSQIKNNDLKIIIMKLINKLSA